MDILETAFVAALQAELFKSFDARRPDWQHRQAGIADTGRRSRRWHLFGIGSGRKFPG